MNKVKLNVVKQVKVDGRTNNTGRPVNKKSARQVRLAKQAFYKSQNDKFTNGNTFKINNDSNGVYMYTGGDNNTGSIVSASHGLYVCNVNYIGRTKVQGFTYVLGKRVNVEINLKNIQFIK